MSNFLSITYPSSHLARRIIQYFFNFVMMIGMNRKQIVSAIAFMMILPLLSGCWTLVAAGAGAYGGYKMKEHGYTLQNPITKEKKSKK